MRTYLPRLLGNEDIRLRIGRAIESNTVPHAFLIGGPSGSGKSTLAIDMAAALNCESKHLDTPLPCGKCNRCRRIYDGSFTDLKILSKKKDRATIGVAAVKEFREDMFLSATESEHKIYIIDDAECMTPEAQNALLKVLEEPPKAVTIILLAKECDRILTTIKSRAQYVAMSRFEDQELAERVLSECSGARLLKNSNPDKFMSLIMSADGRLGVAKELFTKRISDNVEEEREDIIRLIRASGLKSSYTEIYSAIKQLPTKRVDLSSFFEKLMNAVRDLLVTKYDKNARTVFFTSCEEAERLCGDISAKKLVSIYDAIKDSQELLTRNANVSNLLSALCSRLRNA